MIKRTSGRAERKTAKRMTKRAERETRQKAAMNKITQTAEMTGKMTEEPDRSCTLQCRDGVWEVVNEGY